MMRSVPLALVLALTGMLASLAPGRAAPPDRAAEDPLLTQAADLPGFVMFHDSGAPGMVLVVVRGDATLMRFYGETEKGNKHTPDGGSLLRLNSVTKVFTGELLASLA